MWRLVSGITFPGRLGVFAFHYTLVSYLLGGVTRGFLGFWASQAFTDDGATARFHFFLELGVEKMIDIYNFLEIGVFFFFAQRTLNHANC